MHNGYVERVYVLFDKMPHWDAVSWTVMITWYEQKGFLENILEAFKQIKLLGLKPNSITFSVILTVCAIMGDLEESMEINQRLVENDFSLNFMVVNALIDIYAKYGRIHKFK